MTLTDVSTTPDAAATADAALAGIFLWQGWCSWCTQHGEPIIPGTGLEATLPGQCLRPLWPGIDRDRRGKALTPPGQPDGRPGRRIPLVV